MSAEAPAPAEDAKKAEAPAPAADKVEEQAPAEKHMSCFHFPDGVFMIAWLLSVLIMFYIAFYYGYTELTEAYDEYKEEIAAGASYGGSSAIVGCISIAKIFGICAGFAVVTSFVWVLILIVFGEVLIMLLFACAIALFVFMGILTMSTFTGKEGYYIGGVFFLLAGIVALYFVCIRGRIKFAGAVLSVACKIVLHDFGLFCVAFFMLLVTALYCLTFTLAEIGIYFHLENEDASEKTETLAYFVLLLFFFWSVQVFRNIVVVTVSGTAAGWWFGPAAAVSTATAFCRAITYDLGAICFGSLLIAIIQTLHAFLLWCAAKAEATGNCLLVAIMSCLACCVACIARCAEYMNKYAYTYVGIYGYGFIDAGCKVMTLFVNEGLTVIQNDLLIEYLLLFGDVVVAACTCVFGVLLAERGPAAWTEGLHPEARGVVGAVAFVLGYGISGIMMGVVDAATKAVFVLYLENPHVLEKTHETEHTSLKAAWEATGHEERANDVAAEEQGLVPSEPTAAAAEKPDEASS